VLISGNVFLDKNGNGKQDAGELGLAGWTIYIDSNNNGKLDATERSTTTDAKGNWSFNGLAAGKYVIRVVPKSGYTRTTPSGAYTVTLAAGATATNKIFGEKN